MPRRKPVDDVPEVVEDDPRFTVLAQLDKLNDDAWKSLIELLKKHGFPWR